ncbi:MAG: HAMP domain-containing sensor histidine kinase [Bacteroidota bacterium]
MSQQSLQKQNQLSEEFSQDEFRIRLFSMITHDMRNLFASVVGYVRLNKKNPGMNKADGDLLLDELENVGDRANHLFDILFFATRFLNQNDSVRIEKVSPRESFLYAADSMQNDFDRKKVCVEIEIDSALQLNTDTNVFSFVCRQLLHNACKYSRSGNIIQVHYKPKKSTHIFSVRDEGIGIPAEMEPILFTGSKKIIRYGTDDEKGNGFGLALSIHFLKLCNASLTFIPGLKKGSCFEIQIPIKE